MKRIQYLVIAAVVAGCSTVNSGNQPAQPQPSLAGTSWHLISYVQDGFPRTIDTSSIKLGYSPLFSLRFLDSTQFEETMQCNRGSGHYRVNLDTVDFGTWMETMVYCEPGSTVDKLYGLHTFENTGTRLTIHCTPSASERKAISRLVYAKD